MPNALSNGNVYILDMKTLIHYLIILAAFFAVSSCDWYSDPLQLVYPGTDLDGTGEDSNSDKNKLINDFEDMLSIVQDGGWKIVSGDDAVYFIFDVTSGTYETKSTVNPVLRESEYRLSVDEGMKVEIEFGESDLDELISENTLVVEDAKASEITFTGKASGAEVKMVNASQEEIDSILTEEEKLLNRFSSALYDVEEGGGWKISIEKSGETAYMVLDSDTGAYTMKYASDRSSVSGSYSLYVSESGEIFLDMPSSGLAEKIGSETIVLVGINEDGTIDCTVAGTPYVMEKASKNDIDNIKSDIEILLGRMSDAGWGSKLIRKDDGTFMAHWYVDIADETVKFTCYDFDSKAVSRFSPELHASGDRLEFVSSVQVGDATLTAVTVSEDGTASFEGLGSGMKQTDNISYGRDRQPYSMKDWVSGGNQPEFKGVRCDLSQNLQEEYNRIPGFDNVPVFEWNGSWSAIVIYYDNYYFMLYQGGNMFPVEGTDVVRFNKDAGLNTMYGSDISVVTSNYPAIYGFLFGEDHVMARATEADNAGLLLFSTTTDTFIYWPNCAI